MRVYMECLVATYSLDYLSLTIEKAACPENGRAATRVRGEAGDGDGNISRGVSRVGRQGNRVRRASQAQHMQVPYKLDGGIIQLWVALRLSVGSPLPQFLLGMVTGEYYCSGGG
jgi:hypothetical protein